MAIDFGKLHEKLVVIEVDDYSIAFMMVQDLMGPHLEMRAAYLAKRIARLRETYVEIGRELERERRA